ncbi:hypothetical protein OG946_25150 [Streptomyces sp. NBC_01808]|nr:hypothetical protein [Streptomyces sp. NBC_01808]WSA40366.1 hypothetical protein OG946_25150 [Streptomyces sp. NBC_01808]
MVFQAELTFEGVEHRLDPLADTGQSAVPGGFVLAVRPHQVDAQPFGEERLELAPGEALVGEDHLPAADEVVVAFQQRGHHFAFAELGVCQAPGHRHAFGGGEQVEPEPPEEAGVAAAVAVSGVPGQCGAFDRLAGGCAGQRRGVDQPQVVLPGRHLLGQGLDHLADQRTRRVEPFVVGRLLGQIAEEVPEPGVGEADPVPGRGEAEQYLRDGQAQQFGIRQFRGSPDPATRRHVVVDEHVQCRQKGVQAGSHTRANGRPSRWSRPAQTSDSFI